jgi:hypothetical protein
MTVQLSNDHRKVDKLVKICKGGWTNAVILVLNLRRLQHVLSFEKRSVSIVETDE